MRPSPLDELGLHPEAACDKLTNLHVKAHQLAALVVVQVKG